LQQGQDKFLQAYILCIVASRTGTTQKID